ncbi:MAG: hypothetical protein ACI8TQ_002078 [Planctomycetota bacterium]|jgi:hypothetical protein
MMISSLALGLFLTAITSSPSAPASASKLEATAISGSKSVQVLWRGKKYKSTELPEDLPTGAIDALNYFRPWAEEMKYMFQLTDKADFMIVTHKKKMSKNEWSSAIIPTLELTDSLAPLPERGDYNAAEPAEASASGGMQFSWGEVRELEYETATLFRLEDTDHLRSLLQHIASIEKKPDNWSKYYEKLPGLTFHRPLASIIVSSPPEVEEWEPLNETVNRVARMMLLRRFGKIPHWISMGIAWNVEMGVRESIYCFPGRIDFVSVSEHAGWRDPLKSQYRKKNQALDINLLASWEAGAYDNIQAGRAWGLVRYITLKNPEALSKIVEDLRLDIHENGRIDNGNGTWGLIPDYVTPPAVQQDILERHMAASVLKDVATYFNKGMKKPSKR